MIMHNQATIEIANQNWLNGAKFSDNPFSFGSSMWCSWAKEWGRLEDERNDMLAGDDND